VPTGDPAPITLAGLIVAEAAGVERRDLHIEAGRVVYSPAPGARTLDARGFVAFPGLLNAHDHLPLNAIPAPQKSGVFGNAYEWIRDFQPSFRAPEVERALGIPIEVRAAHGGWKNLLAGATTVAHHDPWLSVFEDPGFPVRVVPDTGWCHSLGLAGSYGPTPTASFRATAPGRPWFIHLAEGVDSVAAEELAALDALGALTDRTVLVHGVGLSPADVARVLQSGAGVVWCPSSNLAILGETLDPATLAAAGRLALGTDSRLSGSRDILEELRAARGASGLPARDLVRLVTRDAAALLRERDAGGLEPGMRADVVLLEDGGDPYEAFLGATRAGLSAVVRGGRPLVASPGWEEWFAITAVEMRRGRLDGAEKLFAASLSADAAALEPGLVLS
jgi:cytosine/adenosine deaminase-related metal-dependent hydrolase